MNRFWENVLNAIITPGALIIIILSPVIPGCIEKFDYKPNRPNDSLLVIDGHISNTPDKQFLRIGRTTQYGTLPFIPESGAIVQILENGIIVDACYEISAGIYQIDGDKINACPGQKYSVEILLANGEKYASDPETMPYPVKPDSAYFEMQYTEVLNDAGIYLDDWIINVYIDTPVRAQNVFAFLRWRVLEEYSFTELGSGPFAHPNTCYMKSDLPDQNIQIYSGEDLTGGILKKKLILSRFPEPYVEFIYVHFFNISQYSITRSAYEYWNKLKIVANPTGSFIDTPPAAVIGNVHNIKKKDEAVLGYFEVSAEEITRVSTVPASLLPYWAHNPCLDFPQPDYCYNCLILPNSSLERPSYW